MSALSGQGESAQGRAAHRHAPRLTAVRRSDERVTPLELFFDLVFVLALTQCTTLMAHAGGWLGIVKGLLVLGVLWWAWVGYAWLTSIVDPEEGSVRIAMLTAMAALLVASLAAERAFGSDAALFVGAYAVVRVAHIMLFLLASREDPKLRRSVIGLGVSTAIGVGLLALAAAIGGGAGLWLWGAALALDMAGPYLFGSEGWKLVPGHFAERHGLVVIIALGESIVAIGVASDVRLGVGVVLAAVLGVAIAGALWWLYFDVVALVAERRLTNAKPGKERNEIGRDSYSYLHLPMVAGIVLVALGLKQTIAHVQRPLGVVAATAMFGGAALYLLAHVAFRLRNVHRLSVARLASAVALIAMAPISAAVEPSPLIDLAVLSALLIVLVAYEKPRFASLRERLRE